MSYLVLARKYRPLTFSDVAGQSHVTRTLAHAIERDKVAHAYLFCGPRGVGKTSIARIFAKALNCAEGPTVHSCGSCTNCREITDGRSLAVLEIDGASHNSVDNVRELIDSFRSAPPPGSKYKVYIIDEVHMLSTSAFNALLKSLEEPPAHTVFILATTEVHKIPETVLSRCQRHNFKAITPPVIRDQLKKVADSEGLSVENEVITMIARLSEGSMRDAQTLLDRVQSYCDGAITAADASEVLGAIDRNVLFLLSQAIFSKNADQAVDLLNGAFSRGIDISVLLKEFVSHWRELLIAKVGAEKRLLEFGVAEGDATELLRQVEPESSADIQDLVELARTGADNALRSAYPRYALEALIVRMATREKVKDFTDLIGSLKALLKSGAVSMKSAPTVAATQPAAAAQAGEPTAPPQKTTIAPVKGAPRATLDWNAFVNHASRASGALMLVEQLKRLKADTFVAGILKAQTPELTHTYFKEPVNYKRLQEVLTDFYQAEWNITFSSSNAQGAPAVGSIVEVEQSAKKQQIESQTRNLSSHPSVMSLKKAFPGSTIEKVKVKTK